MATCISSTFGSTTSPQIQLTVSISSSTNEKSTLSYKLEYIGHGYAPECYGARDYSITIGGTKVKTGTYDINGRSKTATITSGTRDITKTRSTQSISFTFSFDFSLTWTGVYRGVVGPSSAGSISVAAKPSYTVSYNANGGSGAPSSQTQWYNESLTLTTSKPTAKTGHTFRNWNTAADGSGTAYSSGGSYKANASKTLYAQWTPNTYAVSYNANGGSGAPSSQTKTYGVNLTLSSTKPTKTGYTFQGWGTSSTATSATYSAGGSYTANSAVTLYAVWKANTYAVSYNANGGSGAPSSQTKTYGVNLTLSSTKPTRTNYEFLGWATSSSATSATYSAGGSYTANSAVTLYAVWKLSYSNPTITNLKAVRCTTSAGTTLADDGTFALVTFNWSCDQNLGANNIKTATVNGTNATISGTTSGTGRVVLGTFSIESTKTMTVVVTDSKNGSTTATTILPTAVFAIDFLAGGKGVAIGGVAKKSEVFECKWPAEFPSGTKIGGDTVASTTALNTVKNSIPSVSGFIKKADLLNFVYPVGSIYMSVSSTSPQTFLGGTWERIKGKFLFAGNDSDSPKVGDTGGAKTVTLTTSNLPSHTHGAGTLAAASAGAHTHNVTGGKSNGGSTTGLESYASTYSSTRTISNAAQSAGAHTHDVTGSTGSTGSGSSFSIMPPYIAVYVWKRTA